MKKFYEVARHFVTSEDGPTAVEYGVMLALIIVAAVIAITALGTSLSDMFDSVEGTLGGDGDATPS